MKKFLIAFALFIGLTSFYNNTIEAQNINISINIGRQPAWGPVGYDYVGYYYFPDIDCYFDVNLGMFYYFNRGRWISARYLPPAYRHYDLYGIHKVVLNVRDPWRYHHVHRRDYARYKGHRSQLVIRDSRDVRYRDSRNNRVAWHSDKRKPADNRKEYRHDQNKGRNNNSGTRYNNDRNKNNNRSDNNKNYSRRDDNKNNAKPDRNKVDNGSRNNSNRDKSKARDSKVTRPSSGKSGEYRLASNTQRSGGRNR